MTEYDNNNRGALWNNDRKQSDKHPDLSGSIMIDGKEYWVSGWKKKQGQGDRAPVVSLSVRPKDYKDSQPTGSPAPNTAQNIDDEIPW
jgi:hypothetical protein